MKVADLNSIYSFLRDSTYEWKEEMRRSNNNKCVLTGTKDNLQVHHLQKSFVEILEEVFIVADIPYRKKVSEYTKEELDKLEYVCKELHRKYKGVPITRRLHTQFHERYGVTGYTEDDFNEFKKMYKNQYRKSKKNNKNF